ncbi:MAG TPA: hypothetical protein VGG29_00160 [Caulobacteraceae bacterium]
MTSQLAITIDDEQKQRLEALAAARSATPAQVAAQAVAEYLAEDAEFRRAVEEGMAAGHAGDVHDFAPFAKQLRKRMAIRAAESDR